MLGVWVGSWVVGSLIFSPNARDDQVTCEQLFVEKNTLFLSNVCGDDSLGGVDLVNEKTSACGCDGFSNRRDESVLKGH